MSTRSGHHGNCPYCVELGNRVTGKGACPDVAERNMAKLVDMVLRCRRLATMVYHDPRLTILQAVWRWREVEQMSDRLDAPGR